MKAWIIGGAIAGVVIALLWQLIWHVIAAEQQYQLHKNDPAKFRFTVPHCHFLADHIVDCEWKQLPKEYRYDEGHRR